MDEKQGSFEDLAAYRELTAEQKRELLDRIPGAEDLLAAYERQDQLLVALSQPQIPARAIGRIWQATAGATRAERRGLTWRRAVPALVALLLVAMLTATGYAVAESLPGDGLYGVKRAGEQLRLAITTREESRLSYQRQLKERRLAEIRSLLAEGRREVLVSFTGLLHQGPDGAWTVAGIPVLLPPGAQPRPGSEVRVEGWTGDGFVRARLMEPQATPEPTLAPVSTPQAESTGLASPTGAPVTPTPEAASSGSPAAAGPGEPQHRQGGTPTEASVPETAVQGPNNTPVRTSTAVPKQIGKTATATGVHTRAPATAAPATTTPKHGASPTVKIQRPTAAPEQTGRPQATPQQQGDRTAIPEQHEERPPDPGTDGAGQSEPTTTSPGGRGQSNESGKP